MFSNPIKRLSESLAQAQEQARQQLAKSQRQDSNSKPLPLFDAEESSFVNDDPPNPPSEPRQSAEPERKDDGLPKEVRIKLAKLAKYEDRHPSIRSQIAGGLTCRVAGCVQGQPGQDSGV
jgi:hypothetical protein